MLDPVMLSKNRRQHLEQPELDLFHLSPNTTQLKPEFEKLRLSEKILKDFVKKSLKFSNIQTGIFDIFLKMSSTISHSIFFFGIFFCLLNFVLLKTFFAIGKLFLYKISQI